MPESSIVETMCFPSDVNKAEVGLSAVLRLEAAITSTKEFQTNSLGQIEEREEYFD